MFIYGRRILATGTGTNLEPFDLVLNGYTLVIAKPRHCMVSTASAYAGVIPSGPAPDLRRILSGDIHEWRNELTNGFEPGVFAIAPDIAAVKKRMYEAGAVYSAMSGSGAAVFGIFSDYNKAENLRLQLSDCDCYCSAI
ncbi:MAG: hypothetical protein K2L80_03215 [Muribaculaceae bacterium]|nr:hypothetical protein [Muribaculaceae bacterium]